MRAPDYAEAQDERVVWDDINRADSEEEYRKAHQTGSRALYFAQCSDENETWLPLLEKAYAKAHGDFASIDGGFTGEAIEDLTGGVTTEIYSTDILDKDAFWRDELMQVGKQFLFGCATGFYSNWLDTSNEPRERDGIAEGHAYSIMDAKEVKGANDVKAHRLLKVRNPWGRKEWTGKWSDGSSEWTAEWMQLLDHKFGNDGIFWISYEDLLKNYQHFDRTRIFGPEWNVTQCWTNVNVSWAAEYHSTKFSITLAEKTRVVIVLAQLDDTYFTGLEGGYGFDLQFRLESDAKEDENDYIVRSNGNYAMARSVSTDIELGAGTYSVLMKITATRNTDKDHLEDVLPMYVATRREKLIQMGLSYDLAHAKGVIVETEAERQQRKAKEKVRKAKDREKLKEKMRADALKHWKKGKERHTRDKQRLKRKEHSQAVRRDGPFVDGRQGRAHNEQVGNSSARTGSLDVQKSESPKQENGDHGRLDGEIEVLRIKSFSGDDIVVERKKTGEKQRPEDTLPQSSNLQLASKAARDTSADNIVEPLEDVIRRADAETAANKNAGKPLDFNTSEQNEDDKPHSEDQPLEEKPPTPIVQVNGVDAITDVKPLPNFPPLSHPEDQLPPAETNSQEPDSSHTPRRSDTLDTTAAMIGIGAATDTNNIDQDLPPFNTEQQDISDADSFPSFDWNTDIDMPSESDSSTTSTNAGPRRRYPLHTRGRRSPGHGRSGHPQIGDRLDSPPPGLDEVGTGSVQEDDGPDESWNAVCVVGLRVYSTLGGDGVKLRVVRPKNALLEDNAGSSEADGDDENDNDHDRADENLLILPNGRRPAKDGKEDDAILLDPDDMARGAVAATAEATAQMVDSTAVGRAADAQNGRLKLGRRALRTSPAAHVSGGGGGGKKGQRRRF